MTARRSIRRMAMRRRKKERETPGIPAIMQTGNRAGAGQEKISSRAKGKPIPAHDIGKSSATATDHLMQGSPSIKSTGFLLFMRSWPREIDTLRFYQWPEKILLGRRDGRRSQRRTGPSPMGKFPTRNPRKRKDRRR